MRRIKAFFHGMIEFRRDFTTSYADEGLQDEYEWGREWAHRLTFRRFDR